MEAAQVEAVTAIIGEHWEGAGRGTLRLLKEQFPGLVFLAVPASDVLEEPAGRAGPVELHFINTQDHCVSVTTDRQKAGGILLAIRE